MKTKQPLKMMTIRVPVAVRDAAKIVAARRNMSLNAFCASLIKDSIGSLTDEPSSSTPRLIPGKLYTMDHHRKGTSTVRLLRVIEMGETTWIDVEIVKGFIKGIGAGSFAGVGMKVRVRSSLATFTPVE